MDDHVPSRNPSETPLVQCRGRRCTPDAPTKRSNSHTKRSMSRQLMYKVMARTVGVGSPRSLNACCTHSAMCKQTLHHRHDDHTWPRSHLALHAKRRQRACLPSSTEPRVTGASALAGTGRFCSKPTFHRGTKGGRGCESGTRRARSVAPLEWDSTCSRTS